MLKNSQTSYGSISKFFHWILFVLIVFMLFLGYFMDDVEKPFRGAIVNIHKLLGLTILLLMILRAIWASINLKPALPLGTPKWQQTAERVGHLLIYVALIAMPVCGWIGAVAAGHSPHLFGLSFGLPVPQSKSLDELCFSIHNTLAIVIIVLISVHTLAALYHYMIKKDDVLQRMMP
jgi:cytochrome b561